VARAYLLAAESDVSGEVFNLGAGKPQPVNELVRLIGGPVVHVPKRPGEPDCTWADISKIQKMLKWEPQTCFADGVAIMLKNISYWKDAPVWTPDSIAEATRRWFECLGK
jgi:UDP-glucose 4-epimerase